VCVRAMTCTLLASLTCCAARVTADDAVLTVPKGIGTVPPPGVSTVALPAASYDGARFAAFIQLAPLHVAATSYPYSESCICRATEDRPLASVKYFSGAPA